MSLQVSEITSPRQSEVSDHPTTGCPQRSDHRVMSTGVDSATSGHFLERVKS